MSELFSLLVNKFGVAFPELYCTVAFNVKSVRCVQYLGSKMYGQLCAYNCTYAYSAWVHFFELHSPISHQLPSQGGSFLGLSGVIPRSSTLSHHRQSRIMLHGLGRDTVQVELNCSQLSIPSPDAGLCIRSQNCNRTEKTPAD